MGRAPVAPPTIASQSRVDEPNIEIRDYPSILADEIGVRYQRLLPVRVENLQGHVCVTEEEVISFTFRKSDGFGSILAEVHPRPLMQFAGSIGQILSN